MTLDPEELVEGLTRRSRDSDESAPPRLLQASAEPPAPLPPMREAAEIAGVHRKWAQVHAGEASHRGGEPSANVRAKVRARVAAVAAEATRSSRQDDRALIGDLIHAVDALATRCDELSGRLHHVQSVVDELIAAVGEDVVQLRAALQLSLPTSQAGRAARESSPPHPPPTDG